MWKTLSPMITIQDLQREQESIIFSQIAIDRNKSLKDVNCGSRIFDPPSNLFLMTFIFVFKRTPQELFSVLRTCSLKTEIPLKVILKLICLIQVR